MLLLLCIDEDGVGEVEEIAYDQYMDVTNIISSVYRALLCVYLR